MTVALLQQFPEIRISINADIGNALPGESDDYVYVVTETGTPTSWQVNVAGNLNVIDENDTDTYLEVVTGDDPYVVVIDEDGISQQLLLVEVINFASGAVAGGQNLPPGQVIPAPGSGNIQNPGGPTLTQP